MYFVLLGLSCFCCIVAPSSAVTLDAWARDVRHGVNGTLWCNVTGDSVSDVTSWYNVNDTQLTSGCDVVNVTYLEYVWPHPQCSEADDMYVFYVNFRRLRDCGNWTCQHSTGEAATVLIQPTESSIESTARPDLDVRNHDNEVDIDCRMRLTECSFPAPSLSLFVAGNDITSTATHVTDSCDLVPSACAMERAFIWTRVHITHDTQVRCVVDSTGMTDDAIVYYDENPDHALSTVWRIVLYCLVGVAIILVLVGGGVLIYFVYRKHKRSRLDTATPLYESPAY